MDQYKKRHFLCLFVDSFGIPNNESYFSEVSDVNRREIMKRDTELKSKKDLLHFVKCIPFDRFSDNKVWKSPDFLLTLRTGDILDHTLLLASLFMGMKDK